MDPNGGIKLVMKLESRTVFVVQMYSYINSIYTVCARRYYVYCTILI